MFPDSKGQPGAISGDEPSNKTNHCFGEFDGRNPSTPRNDVGSSARFFYSAKVSKKERNAGLPEGTANTHPTVKPIALMRYLCRLVTPQGGTVLDPFTGSGSTGVAAIEEGFNFVGCEMTDDYIKIATARLKAAVPGQVHDYSADDESPPVKLQFE
jgi:site-specific DNA-methyltransferase (adenine-specific)